MADNEIKMTYSAILRDKDNKKLIRVQFERMKNSVSEVAEGILPDGKIVRQNGYSQDEINQLEEYLKVNSDDIFSKAKSISNPLKWL